MQIWWISYPIRYEIEWISLIFNQSPTWLLIGIYSFALKTKLISVYFCRFQWEVIHSKRTWAYVCTSSKLWWGYCAEQVRISGCTFYYRTYVLGMAWWPLPSLWSQSRGTLHPKDSLKAIYSHSSFQYPTTHYTWVKFTLMNPSYTAAQQ